MLFGRSIHADSSGLIFVTIGNCKDRSDLFIIRICVLNNKFFFGRLFVLCDIRIFRLNDKPRPVKA